ATGWRFGSSNSRSFAEATSRVLLTSCLCIEDRKVRESYVGVHAEVRCISTKSCFRDRPRPCKAPRAPRRYRERLVRGNDAPVKSVCPLGTGVPNDATSAGNGV